MAWRGRVKGSIEKNIMEIDVRSLLEEKIEKAAEGRRLWLSLVERYNAGDRDYFILMPSAKQEYNHSALVYLDRFIESRKAEKVYVLAYDKYVFENGRKLSEKATEFVEFSRQEAEALMQFYCMYQFTDKLIIASLDEPDGRNAYNLVGRKGITIEDVMAVGVYGLRKEEE